MGNSAFKQGITRYWWLPMLTGLVCIALGIWTLCSPASALPVLAYVFAIGMICAAIFDLSFGFGTSRFNTQWGWEIAIGIMELIGGIWLLTLPVEAMTVAFMYIVGIWILISAINSIAQTFALSVFSPAMTVWAVLLLLATIFFAMIFLFNPIAGGIAVWMWIGIALITYGCFRMTIAGTVKRFRDTF